jgi:feruloyl esterase
MSVRILLLAATAALVPSLAAAQDCNRVAATLKLPDATVTAARLVSAGSFTPPATGGEAPRPIANLPAFCRVELTIKPSSDSDIKTEVWMPVTGWNGKFQQVGNGAFAGSIQYGALGDALRRGYATASTDTGHTGPGAQWAAGHPEKIIDWGYRSEHLTAVHSKQAITNFYGVGPKLSYFTGCSGGGRMAFQEAQRYPADFDAILAGAPAYDRGNEAFGFMAKWQATHETPQSVVPASKYPAIHRAALDACDALDGLKDGLIEDVLGCHFDPAVLQCGGGRVLSSLDKLGTTLSRVEGSDPAACLTTPQVEAVRKLYAGARHPKTGALIFPGFEPGSELQWSAVAGGDLPLDVGYDVFKYILLQDPTWDPKTFDLAKDYDRIHKLDNTTLSPSDPNLQPFFSRGGKLLIYQGWADPNVSPRSPLMYYDRVVKTVGQKLVDEGMRLFYAPGMGHCGGGEGPNVFDALTPLEQWREQGTPPSSILATHSTGGQIDRSRPLCPYPQIARYKGTGSVDQAENFSCAARGE